MIRDPDPNDVPAAFAVSASLPASFAVIRSYLYVPAHRPEYISSAVDSGADAVVIDFEDGLGSAEPSPDAVSRCLQAARAVDHPPLIGVRVSVSTPALQVARAMEAGADFLRIAKVEAVSDVALVMETTRTSRGNVPLQLLIESAAGIAAVEELAKIHGVWCFVLGASDLAADLGILSRTEPGVLDYARGRLVFASAAARISAPVESVFRTIDDLENLKQSSIRAKEFGFFGRSAIHPRQIPVINDVFTPTEDDLAWASSVLERLGPATGAARTEDGEMVDSAVARIASTFMRRAQPKSRRTAANDG